MCIQKDTTQDTAPHRTTPHHTSPLPHTLQEKDIILIWLYFHDAHEDAAKAALATKTKPMLRGVMGGWMGGAAVRQYGSTAVRQYGITALRQYSGAMVRFMFI